MTKQFTRASFVFIRHYPSPQTFRSPDTSAQTFQLHDLAVIDEEIHIRSVIFDIPREYIRIGRFEHKLFHPKFADESRGHLRSPRIDILGDAFALDHDDLRAGVEESLGLRNRPA